jgi:hypothetical protein
MARQPLTIEELRPYYRGAFYATIALKRRLGALGPAGREAIQAVDKYQRMIKEFSDALEATVKLKREQQGGA